jgi:hypothetical protein
MKYVQYTNFVTCFVRLWINRTKHTKDLNTYIKHFLKQKSHITTGYLNFILFNSIIINIKIHSTLRNAYLNFKPAINKNNPEFATAEAHSPVVS